MTKNRVYGQNVPKGAYESSKHDASDVMREDMTLRDKTRRDETEQSKMKLRNHSKEKKFHKEWLERVKEKPKREMMPEKHERGVNGGCGLSLSPSAVCMSEL